MPPAGFELTIAAGERPQTHALDCAANGTGKYMYIGIVTPLYWCAILLVIVIKM